MRLLAVRNLEPMTNSRYAAAFDFRSDVRAWNKKGDRKTSPAGRLDTWIDYCPRLAGGTIPFIRRYSTIWP